MDNKEINDSFRSNPSASTIVEDFFKKVSYLYSDEHVPSTDNPDLTGHKEEDNNLEI